MTTVYILWLRLETPEERAPYELRVFATLAAAEHHADAHPERCMQLTSHAVREE